MTPAHSDMPLRRSEAGVYRDSGGGGGGSSSVGGSDVGMPGDGSAAMVTFNDDDAERLMARRRTLVQANTTADSSTFEENETLKRCLEMYNGNKLSRENAWSTSLIDTLSTLLDRHHKTLNNFKVAGSSLEASSKVYSLRVDSIHTDVLRMSAGLNAQKFNERQLADDDDDDGVATGGDGAADPNSSAGGLSREEEIAAAAAAEKAKKQKKRRKLEATITKNMQTLNSRLDTVPLHDPVFSKLNAIVGSINASNRLITNVLLTTDSELRLRTNFKFWSTAALEKEGCDYTAEWQRAANMDNVDSAPCDRLFTPNYEKLLLRALHTGYVISDTPEIIADDKEKDPRRASIDDDHFGGGDDGNDIFHNTKEMSMAFDINAECEPMPLLSEVPQQMLEVDCGEFEDLTVEERTAINKCRGLRKATILIEDLRPVDASSRLEYSYRPLDKISQFWAGPSHWKFKRSRARPSTLSQHGENAAGRTLGQRGRRAANMLAKKRSKQLNFLETHDELFIKLDNKYKARKLNMQKKWDQRKLKLPTDLQLDRERFFKFKFAPGIAVEAEEEEEELATLQPHMTTLEGEHPAGTAENNGDMHTLCEGGANEDHFADGDECGGGVDLLNTSAMSISQAVNASEIGEFGGGGGYNVGDNTVLEIATEFADAPSQVTKIIVPFAKRAKVIDMKNLKRCCRQLMLKQMQCPRPETSIPQHPIIMNENYAAGMASFQEIYKRLPELLNQTMAEALSTSVAFYSVLHLANDCSLRLIPQEDLEDFKIREVLSNSTPPSTSS